MDDSSPSNAEVEPAGKGRSCLKVFLILLLVVAVAVGGFFLTGKWTVDAVKKRIVSTFEQFQPEAVVATFDEWRDLQVQGNDGNILEVATVESTETFSRKSQLEWLGRKLPLGTTASEISVPATFRYHIDLNGTWKIEVEESEVRVLAPPVSPSLPVAFDTGGMKKKTQSGWARWDGAANLEALEATITENLAERAGSDELMGEVRDKARGSVAKFVESWLIGQDAWSEGRFDSIVVHFSDESEPVVEDAIQLIEDPQSDL